MGVTKVRTQVVPSINCALVPALGNLPIERSKGPSAGTTRPAEPRSVVLGALRLPAEGASLWWTRLGAASSARRSLTPAFPAELQSGCTLHTLLATAVGSVLFQRGGNRSPRAWHEAMMSGCVAQGCRVERRDRSSAIWGTPDVLPT
jgi:hypothetical protein